LLLAHRSVGPSKKLTDPRYTRSPCVPTVRRHISEYGRCTFSAPPSGPDSLRHTSVLPLEEIRPPQNRGGARIRNRCLASSVVCRLSSVAIVCTKGTRPANDNATEFNFARPAVRPSLDEHHLGGVTQLDLRSTGTILRYSFGGSAGRPSAKLLEVVLRPSLAHVQGTMIPVARGDAGAQCDARITPSWMIMFAGFDPGLNSSVCASGLVMLAGAHRKTPRS